MTDESRVTKPFSGLTFDRVESFLAVADAGSITKVAPKNLSRQSQISRQIRELGEALGFELVAREGRGLVLTEDGRRVRALFRELESGLDAIKRERASASVRLTLAAGDSVLRWVVLPVVHRSLHDTSRVELSLSAVTQGYLAVRDGAFDMAISRVRKREDGMKLARIGTLRYAVFAPKAWVKRYDRDRSLRALPFVHVTGAPDLMQTFEERVGRPSVALSCETFPQAALAVQSGHYAALLPTLAAQDLSGSGVATLALDGLSALDLPLALVARERRIEAVPTFAALFDTLAKLLASSLSGAK